MGLQRRDVRAHPPAGHRAGADGEGDHDDQSGEPHVSAAGGEEAQLYRDGDRPVREGALHAELFEQR